MNNFVLKLMNKLELPQDAKAYFYQLSKRISFVDDYIILINHYDGSKEKTEKYIKKLKEIALNYGETPYSVYYLFFLECSENMYNKYIEKNLPLDVYYDSIEDLKYKFEECFNVKGVYGTFVPQWFGGFYSAERFKLGRFQYEIVPFPYERYEKDGIVILKNEPVLNIHIPSSGSMPEKERNLSYKMASDFYKKHFDFCAKAFVCNSWLLYPEHYKFLDPDSNIVGFMRDFDIIDSNISEKFTAAWRIFGASVERGSIDKWPRNTKLQKAYYNWIMSGNKTGTGYGIKISYI